MSKDLIISLKESIIAKKLLLDKYQPIDPIITKNMGQWLRNEITYTSNALEGNTLTRQETHLILEEGITIGGKRVNEILETINHDSALKFVIELAKNKTISKLKEQDLLNIHSIILKGIDDINSGKYRNLPVRISGSTMIPPNYLKVPELMKNMVQNINQNSKDKYNTIDSAIEAHYQLVSIHPFVDGNGRTARLLLNLILLMDNYPMVFIAKEERTQYLSALEKAQIGGSKDDYELLMLKAIERSLDLYLNQIENKTPQASENKSMTISQIAKGSLESVSTIRYWTTLGLIKIFKTDSKGYTFYSQDQITRAKQIRFLQKEKRLTLSEIKKLIK